jgi:hypothetical protein
LPEGACRQLSAGPSHSPTDPTDGLKMPHPVRCPNFFFRKINLYGKTKKSTHGHTTPRPFDLPFWLLAAKKNNPTTRHHHPHHGKNACTTQFRLPCTACTQRKLRAPRKIVYPAPSSRFSRAACKSNYRTSPPLRGKRMHHIKSTTRHYMQCIFPRTPRKSNRTQ